MWCCLGACPLSRLSHSCLLRSVCPPLLWSQLLKAEQYNLVDKVARDFKVSDKL